MTLLDACTPGTVDLVSFQVRGPTFDLFHQDGTGRRLNGDTVDRTAGCPSVRSWWRLAISAVAIPALGCGLVTGCGLDPPGDPQAGTGAHRTVQSVLDAQSVALLEGDEAGFLGVVDPTQPPLVSRYRDLFATLRGLLVSGWQATVSSVDGDALLRAPDHPVDVTVGYCFGTAQCPTALGGAGLVARATMRMSFAVSRGRIVITGLLPAASQSSSVGPTARGRQLGAAPWQVSSLHAMSGRRTVVATTPALRERLPAALAAAEAAAVVADQYAFLLTPDRYHVYLAGPDEWSTWFDLPHGNEVARAITTSPRTTDIVVHAGRVTDDALEALLRKEMGRVVTHVGASVQSVSSDRQWVSEGIAELVRYAGEPPSSAEAAIASLRAYLPALSALETFLDQGLPTEATAGAAFSTASYLAINYITYRFGPEGLFSFVDAVLRGRMPVPKATARVLGMSWADLQAEFWYAVVLL